MNYKNIKKKLAFTLVEIVIALFIVAILAMLTLPVINRQLDKSDEYAYYMAFKSVEKMASQIVTLGEEYNESSSALPVNSKVASVSFGEKLTIKVKGFFNDISSRIAFSEKSLMKKLFPKAFADVSCPSGYVCNTVRDTLFESDAFVYDIWAGYAVCKGNQLNKIIKTKKSVVDSTTGASSYKYEYYGKDDFNRCYGYTEDCKKSKCDSYTYKAPDGSTQNVVISETYANDVLKPLIPSDEMSTNFTLSSLVSGTGYSSSKPTSGEALCQLINQKVKSTYTDDSGTKYQNEVTWVPYEEEEEDTDGDDESLADFYDLMSDIDGKVGYCELVQTVMMPASTTASSSSEVAEREKFYDSDCQTKGGYYNFELSDKVLNSGSSVPSDKKYYSYIFNCVPKDGYEISENNPKVACQNSDSNMRYYAVKTNSGYSCVPCESDFNESAGACCPQNSISSGSGCDCILGWKRPDGAPNTAACSIRTECPEGYSPDSENNQCVLNPPIIRASRFSELIAKNWNIKKDYSSEITYTNLSDLSGAKYYKEVYEAALGNSSETSDRLMSIDSKPGAFAFNPKTGTGLKPNVILANGLHLWIMSDRLASIPGLTYSTDNSKPSRNVCKNLNKKTKESCLATSTDAYFCASEVGCYTLASSSLKDGTKGLGDARNCCASPDLSDIAAAKSSGAGSYSDDDYFNDVRVYGISGFTIFVDINGAKGEGTLWKDVFPFYVSSNGTVYPGYPLDGVKTEDSGHINTYLGGNSEKQLPTDVYFFESTGDDRKKVTVLSNVSYARALCTTRKISKNSPYCKNLGENFYQKAKYKNSAGESFESELKGTAYLANDSTTGTTKSINPCDYEACFMAVRRKLRSF